jgi:hypothetical protein
MFLKLQQFEYQVENANCSLQNADVGISADTKFIILDMNNKTEVIFI